MVERESPSRLSNSDRYALKRRQGSFRVKNPDTWTKPVRGALGRLEAKHQDKKSNCVSFSFLYLPRIPKNLKSEPRTAFRQLPCDALPHRHSTHIQTFSKRNSFQGPGKSLVGYGGNGP